MTGFDELMAGNDAAIMQALGDDVTYAPAGGTAQVIKAIVRKNVERIGDDGYTIEKRTEIEFLYAGLSYPQRGDVLTHQGVDYSVDGVLSDDGAYVVAAVR